MIAKKVLSTAVWLAALSWVYQWACNDNLPKNEDRLGERKEIVVNSQQDSIINNTKKDVFVCLEKDNEKSFTYTKVVESITDPYNTVLEFPVDHLFQKYWNNNQYEHPLSVPLVAKKMRSLLWTWWIESSDVPQTLNQRLENVTSETKYEVWDTLRVRLIDADLLEYFPEDLADQLKEEWFETFFDKDSLLIRKLNLKDTLQILSPAQIDSTAIPKWTDVDNKESNDYIYDIVVKTLHSGESALALYRNGKLFMTSKVSVWLPGHSTRTWQFEIISDNPYARSPQYGNSPMPYALQYTKHYYFHQWVVTWRPASHWCVRLTWIKSLVLYSSVIDKKHTDVYIDKKLNHLKTQKTYIRQKK